MEKEKQYLDVEKLNSQHRKLNSQLKSYKSAADKEYRDARNALIDEWEEFEQVSHWGKHADASKPSIPLTLNVRQAQVSKVFDRPVKLSVIPQENSNFPIGPEHPFRQMLAQNAGSLEGVNPQAPEQNEKSDNEYHALFMNALLQREWEVGELPNLLYRAGDLAAFAGECAIVTGKDPMRVLRGESPMFFDIVNAKRLIKDPDATGPEDTRAWGYEVERTAGHLEDVYGVNPDEFQGDSDENTSHEDGGKGRNRLVKLITWFVRDEGLEEVGEEDGETVEAPKYRAGWLRVVTCQGRIISEPEDAGKLSLHWLPWLRVPGKLAGQGVMDLFRTMNFQVDTSMFYLQENAKTTGQNYFFADAQAFIGNQDKLNNLPGKVIPATSINGDIKQSIFAVQGLEVSSSHVQNINLNREMIDSISQVVDIRNGDNLPKDASGEFLKEAKGSGALRLAQIRDQEVIRVAKEIARCILDYVLDDDQPVTLKLPGIGEPKYVQIVPSALKFDDQEFEAKFDIVADGSAAEPHDPLERDMFYARIIAELSQTPQPLAELRINLADWTRKEEIRKSLQDFWEQQAQQAQAPNPVEEAKANAQAAKDLSQFVQGACDNLADKGQLALAIAIQFAAIPQTYSVTKGQQPNVMALIQEAQGILPVVTQLINSAPVTVTPDQVIAANAAANPQPTPEPNSGFPQ